MWELILSNPMVCLEYFVVNLIVIVGLTLNCFNGRSRGFGDGDGVKLKRTLGVVRFLFRLGWIICISMVDV